MTILSGRILAPLVNGNSRARYQSAFTARASRITPASRRA